MKVSDEDIIYASQHTNSAAQAARMLNIKYDTYKKHAKALDCFVTNQSGKGCRKSSKHLVYKNILDSYFNVIDCDQKAYLLGFIAADGSVNRSALTIKLHEKDIEILYVFCDEFKIPYDCIKHEEIIRDFGNGDVLTPAVVLTVSSVKMVIGLKQYNIVSDKSHKDNDLLQYVPSKYRNSWIAGYVDGDGCIRKGTYGIEIVSNKETLNSIARYLDKKCGIKPDVYRNYPNNITAVLSYYKKSSCALFLLLYLSAPYHLSRKLSAANDMLNLFVGKSSINIHNHNHYCVDCGCVISNNAIRCRSCALKLRYKNTTRRPEMNVLAHDLSKMSFVDIAKKYGVSDNAVRKWCKYYKLPSKHDDVLLWRTQNT